MRVAPLQQDVRFGAHDEEGRLQCEAVEPLEVDVAAIHHVERSGLGQDAVEHVDVVHLAVGNVDEGGDVAAQIEQRVHLDGGLVAAETRPGKQAETQIDGGRIQRVKALVQIHAHRFAGIKRPRDADQYLREVGDRCASRASRWRRPAWSVRYGLRKPM